MIMDNFELRIKANQENQIEALSYKELLGVIHELTTALYDEKTFASDPLTLGFDDYINRLSTEQKIAFLCLLCERLECISPTD